MLKGISIGMKLTAIHIGGLFTWVTGLEVNDTIRPIVKTKHDVKSSTYLARGIMIRQWDDLRPNRLLTMTNNSWRKVNVQLACVLAIVMVL